MATTMFAFGGVERCDVYSKESQKLAHPSLAAKTVTFETVLHKPAGGKLGFCVTPVTLCGSSGIFVKSLTKGGAVEEHNRTCVPDQMISPGDCIVRAGSVSLHAQGIMQALSEADEIQISVLRQVSLANAGNTEELQCPAVSEECMPQNLSNYLSQASTVAPASCYASVDSVASDSSFGSTLCFDSGLATPPGLAPIGKLESQALGALPESWLRRASNLCGGLPEAGSAVASKTQEDSVERVPAVKAKQCSAKAKGKTDAKKGKVKAELSPDTKLTTIMLRQLPQDFARNNLEELLTKQGFAGLYDFVYMPINMRTQKPFTYAFVNLVSTEVAALCNQILDGYSAWEDKDAQPCIASWADSEQGLDANIERYRNSPVMHESVPDSFKPAIFQAGLRVAFPPPTKALKAPPKRKALGIQDAVAAQSFSNEDAKSEGELSIGQAPSDCSTASTAGSAPHNYRVAMLRAMGLRPPPGLENEAPAFTILSF